MLDNLRAVAAAALFTVGTATASLAETPLEYTHEIAPGVFSFGGGNGYHSMFLVTDDGVVVFETVNSAHGEKMVAAIGEVTDLKSKLASAASKVSEITSERDAAQSQVSKLTSSLAAVRLQVEQRNTELAALAKIEKAYELATQDLASLKAFVGDDYQSPHIDPAEAELVESRTIKHYDLVA